MNTMFTRWRERLAPITAALALGWVAGDAAGQIPARLPVITNQPQNLTVQAGQPAVFTVGARDATNVPPVSRVGGPNPDRFVYEAGTPRGTLLLAYDFLFSPDQVEVFYGGARIYDSGSISNSGTLEIPFGPGAATVLEIVVNGTNGVPGTIWEYNASIVRPPLSYQWRRNGTPLPGSVNSTHTIAAAQPADAGTYSVIVSNASGIAVSSGAMLNMLTSAPGCFPPPAGLAAWWPFNGDGMGARNGANMFLFGNAAFAPGRVGQGLTFDGTFDYGIAVGSPALDVGAGAGLTVELWIKPDDLSSLRPLVEWNSGSGDIGAHLWVSVSGTGTLYADLRDTTGGNRLIETPPGVLQTSVWQHVALTYDKGSGVARLLVNGSVAAQASLGVFTPQTSFPL